MPRYEKAKAKTKAKKRRFISTYSLEESNVPTFEDVMRKTITGLRNLGSQTFAISPFREHFDRWLTDLRVVLSEFESNPSLSVDDQFVKECSKILSNVEVSLEERRKKEAALEESVKSLSDNRILLQRIESEYAANMAELKKRSEDEIKRLSSNVDHCKEELDRVTRMKAGLFRSISKNAKAQKEAETAWRLSSAQNELKLAVRKLTDERRRLRNEYEASKQRVIGQIESNQRETEDQDTDGSLETRRAACDALATAVNALAQRRKP